MKGGAAPLSGRFLRAAFVLLAILSAAVVLALWAGSRTISVEALRSDPVARLLFFRLRLPRVMMAGLVGSSLAIAGAALQALFRNPLADPFTLGVSGGGALGASVAIALGWGVRIAGVPAVFLAAFAGAMFSVMVVHQVARTGAVVLPGALLLSGVVFNLFAAALVVAIQFFADPERALQILRWMVGSLDVVGFDTVVRMLILLVPSWAGLLLLSRDLHLLAIDEDTAASLGVPVRRTEVQVHILCSLMVGVTVAVGGSIGFVGLIVPHVVRLLFGEDLRIVIPGSFLLGAAFLILADALARTALPNAELPVGAVTALLGGPVFLWLLRSRQRYSAA
ncbi:MAG TPA: iron ABC transporter permease [Bryobacteraceae bacterium]|nr:iron ABC transporter permease [Bryobacteraceae bacterium]